MIICLTGFMGCGKSSVGRRLSELLCCPFMDLDQVIEERTGGTIPEIFATDGEAEFRAMELEALKSIVCGLPMYSRGLLPLRGPLPSLVLALGGGTVMTAECAEIVHSQTHCIYLQASVETFISHLENEAAGRPMLADSPLSERIITLMAQRSATYEKTAHVILDTDGKSIEAIASEIISLLD